uniref:Uncharacterized protein n=1 Tax=Setaria italica TaxID=4555 RepID=K3YNQ0_SETIT
MRDRKEAERLACGRAARWPPAQKGKLGGGVEHKASRLAAKCCTLLSS